MQFTNADGAVRFGRYQIVPEAGVAHLDDAGLAAQGPSYLFDELTTRVAAGPVGFRILVQLAEAGDVVDDATIHWAADRPVVELGVKSLTPFVADEAREQQQIIFDPIPRVEGIAP